MIKRFSLIIAGVVLAYVSSVGISLVQLRSALFEEDAAQLTQSVDFDSVRGSLKVQIDELVKRKLGQSDGGNMLAALGMAIAGPMVEQMIETYVTPAGIFELISKGKPQLSKASGGMFRSAPEAASETEQDKPPKTFLRSVKGVEWIAIDRFKLMFFNKKGQPTADLLFHLDGFRWRLVEIQLPALMSV